MPIDPRMRAQVALILNSLDRAAAWPGPERWDDEDVNDVEYLYRDNWILAREQDAARVTDALGPIFREAGHGQTPEGEERRFESGRVAGSVHGIPLPTQPDEPRPPLMAVPDVLRALEGVLWRGVAAPEHIGYVCGYPCPATEPHVVPPGTAPFPPPGRNACSCRPCHRIPWPECDGDGVVISIVDTGLMPDAADGHPWLARVDGALEEVFDPQTGNIKPYAGHGTFSAGVASCMAPRASIYVERAFDIAGADYETRLAASLEDALDRNPDILVFTFTTPTRDDHPLLTFDDFYKRRIRYLKGLVVLAPAGNDGQARVMWPAGYRGVISVGALAADWRNRADYSNYGRWVDVFAPGTDLVNAFPTGTYMTNEPPGDQRREFHGMARWSGTSFSTPMVAGLIAARMSATGESAQQAADSLLRLACGQAIPGAGAVLYPGQACCDACRCRH